MLDDPIVEEVRKVRQEYAAKFDYDLRSIFLDIKRQEVEYRKKGWKVMILYKFVFSQMGQVAKTCHEIDIKLRGFVFLKMSRASSGGYPQIQRYLSFFPRFTLN